MKYGPKMRSGDLSKLKNDLRRQENDLRRLPPSLKWLPKSPDIRTSISQNMHQCKGAGSRVIYTSKIVQKRREQVKLRASSADPPWATHQLNVPFLKLPLNQLFLERVSWTLFLRWLSFPWLGVPGPLEGEHWFTIYSIWSHLPILQFWNKHFKGGSTDRQTGQHCPPWLHSGF